MCRKLPRNGQSTTDELWGLLIPIVVLVIVFFGTGVIYLFIPVLVLVLVLLFALVNEGGMGSMTSEQPLILGGFGQKESSERPMYEKWKRKEEGVSVGLLIPIFILGILFMTSGGSWALLIPIAVLVIVFAGDAVSDKRRGERVRAVLSDGHGRTLSEIADGAGMPEAQVIPRVVHEKRRGRADVWFDPMTGVATDQSTRVTSEAPSRASCAYCGFALRDEDRFCPYCGAPIRVS